MKKELFALWIILLTTSIKGNEYERDLVSFYKDKRVLVTGGCGFIGSHLVETLVSLGARITIVDDLSTGSLENIASYLDSVQFIHGSIENKNLCMKAAEEQNIIFHLAAFVSVPLSVEEPERCHQINVNGTVNLLEAARVHATSRLVLSSSCSIYGESEDICTEDTEPNPSSPYAFSKLISELYCQQYWKVYQVPTVILRYFNVYGKRQNPHATYAAAYARFVYQMERNLPITIFGDGLQTRDFVSVQEVVRANLYAGMAEKESVAGEVFNIGTGKSISILDLIDQLKEKYPDYTGAISFEAPRPGDVKHVRSSCAKFKTVAL